MNSLKHTIIYTNNRHAYARRKGDTLEIKIPHRHRNNQELINSLIAKVQQKTHQKESFQTQTDTHIRIRGERQDKSEIVFDINEYLKDTFFAYSQLQVEAYCDLLGVSHTDFKIKKVQSKRGSCTHDNKIMLNLSLIHLPKEYTDYVAAHECCHILQKNHSRNFWNLVHEIYPNFQTIRKQLRVIKLS